MGQDNVRVYGCGYHRDRGEAVCANKLRRPVDTIDEAVVAWVRRHVLSEEVVAAALVEVRRRLAARSEAAATDAPKLAREASTLRREIDRLTVAIATSDEKPDALVSALDERHRRLRSIEGRLGALEAAPSAIDLELRRMEREARERVKDLRGLLERNPAEARQAMQAILDGPLVFSPIETPTGRRYQIEGQTSAGPMFTTGNVPRGIRTPVSAVKGHGPGPLDDGDRNFDWKDPMRSNVLRRVALDRFDCQKERKRQKERKARSKELCWAVPGLHRGPSG